MLETIIHMMMASEKLPWILMGIITVLAAAFYARKKENAAFDLRNLIVNQIDNTMSLNKFGQLISLIISSWGFVYLMLNDKMSEMYLTIYLATWAGTTLISKGISAYSSKTTDTTKSPVKGD